MADTPHADDILRLAAERLRAGDDLPAIDPSLIAEFLDDTAEGIPGWGPETSEQEFAVRIARSVLAQRVPAPPVDREKLAQAVHDVRHKGYTCTSEPTGLDYEIADGLISAGMVRVVATGQDGGEHRVG